LEDLRRLSLLKDSTTRNDIYVRKNGKTTKDEPEQQKKIGKLKK
jgi:hypothetical protein